MQSLCFYNFVFTYFRSSYNTLSLALCHELNLISTKKMTKKRVIKILHTTGTLKSAETDSSSTHNYLYFIRDYSPLE